MSLQISTPLTSLLNVRLPIISAPMAISGVVDIASAVSAASGFGMMGAGRVAITAFDLGDDSAIGFSSSEEIKSRFQTIRRKLSLPQDAPVPIGIGFIGWVLDKTEVSDDPRIEAALKEKPVAIWFAFGEDLGKYIAQVRAFDAKREHKTTIFVMVNSVEDALQAANEWKVDVIVAQGIEAGGHGGSYAPPLFSLLQAVIKAVPSGPLIVAAGGISTGSQIAALLTMGAAGVVLGTRFLFTTECSYPTNKKEALLHADLNATTRSLAFDEVGRTMGWPPNQDGRAIRNQIIADVEEGLDLEERIGKFDESASSGDTSRLIVWAGVGVGLTDRITTAEDVVLELSRDMVKALKSASGLILS